MVSTIFKLKAPLLEFVQKLNLLFHFPQEWGSEVTWCCKTVLQPFCWSQTIASRAVRPYSLGAEATRFMLLRFSSPRELMYHPKFDLLHKNDVCVHHQFDQIQFFKKLTVDQGIPVRVPGSVLLPVNLALSPEPGALMLPHWREEHRPSHSDQFLWCRDCWAIKAPPPGIRQRATVCTVHWAHSRGEQGTVRSLGG